MLNELRVQYARRHQFRTQGLSVEGPAVTVTGVAQFGGARLGDGNSVGFDFNQGITQVIDNVSWIRGRHALQGRHRRAVDRRRADSRRAVHSTRSRPPMPIWLRRAEPIRSATRRCSSCSATGRRQLQFGVLRLLRPGRLAGHAAAESCSTASDTTCSTFRRRGRSPPTRMSQDFTVDKNNFAPRAGLSWAVDPSARTVVRASVGLMYEPPLLDFYDNAILNNGDPASFTVSVLRHQRGCAAVPGQPCRPAAHVRAAAAEHHRRRPGLRTAVGVAEQRPGRACAAMTTSRSLSAT